MLCHVFIVNVKEGISDDAVEMKMAEMRVLHSRTHTDIAERAGKAFDMQSADIARIEY